MNIENGDIAGRTVTYTYSVNGKKVSEKKYNTYVKKLEKRIWQMQCFVYIVVPDWMREIQRNLCT